MSHKGLSAFVTLHCERPWVIDFLLASKEHWHFHGLKMDTVQMRKALGDRTPSFWNNEILSLNSRAHTDTLFNLQPLLRPPEAVQQYPIVSHWPHLLIMSTQEVLCLRKHLTTAHFWWVWTWGYINQTSRLGQFRYSAEPMLYLRLWRATLGGKVLLKKNSGNC